MGSDGLVHESPLDARDAFLRHFDAQVAACHHDAVGRLQYLVDVVHSFLVLDFRDDADVAAGSVEQMANFGNVLLGTYETVGYESHVVVNGKGYVLAVALRECRQVDAYARHVDTLTRAQCGVVLHVAGQHPAVLVVHHEPQVAVVNEDVRSHVDILGEILVSHGNRVARCPQFRVAHDVHHVALFEINGRVGGRGAHLRSFGVDEDGHVARHLAHIVDDAFHARRVLVCRVEAYHVHAGIVEPLDKSHIAALV